MGQIRALATAVPEYIIEIEGNREFYSDGSISDTAHHKTHPMTHQKSPTTL